jgi:hypothetical protein
MKVVGIKKYQQIMIFAIQFETLKRMKLNFETSF